MHSAQFAERYRRDDIDFSDQSPSLLEEAGAAFMEGPRKWSQTFNALVWDYLSEQPVDYPTAKTNIMRYSSDSVQHLMQNNRINLQEYAYHLPTLAPSLDTLHFHTVNRELLRYWDILIDPENQDAPTDSELAVMQARLSIHALELVAIRAAYQRKGHDRGVSSPIDKPLARQIGKTDGAIALLEVLKQQPAKKRDALALLPVSPDFADQSTPTTPFDYLIIDRAARQAHGLYMTANKPNALPLEGSTFASPLDTIHDLRDFRTDSTSAPEPTKKPLPGLLAADFILNNPIGRVSEASHTEGLEQIQGRLIDARSVAHEMFPTISDVTRLQRIANAVGDRIMRNLYAN